MLIPPFWMYTKEIIRGYKNNESLRYIDTVYTYGPNHAVLIKREPDPDLDLSAALVDIEMLKGGRNDIV
jgi:hypothetical protein